MPRIIVGKLCPFHAANEEASDDGLSDMAVRIPDEVVRLLVHFQPGWTLANGVPNAPGCDCRKPHVLVDPDVAQEFPLSKRKGIY